MRLFDIIQRHRRRPRSRGQSIVELALILPVLMLLVAATLDLGRIFYSQITVSNAAREGAVEASSNPTSFIADTACNTTTNRVMCRVINEAKGSFVTVSTSDVAMTCSPSCTSGSGHTATVTVTGHFRLLTPLMAAFTGGQDLTFRSSAAVQIATPPATGVASTPTPSPTPSPTPTPTPTPSPSGSSTPGPTPTPTPSPTVTPCFAPTAQFTVSPTSGFRDKPGRPGTVFTFTDTSLNMTTGCNPIWSWNFGDGSGTSSLRSPTYVYLAQNTHPGFTVTLVVSNSVFTDTASVVIPVSN